MLYARKSIWIINSVQAFLLVKGRSKSHPSSFVAACSRLLWKVNLIDEHGDAGWGDGVNEGGQKFFFNVPLIFFLSPITAMQPFNGDGYLF